MTKSEIRSKLLAVRNNMSAEEKSLSDIKLQNMLYSTMNYQDSNNLFCFVSFKSETDTHEIIRHSLAEGKKVYIPRVEPQGMEFYHIQNLDGLIPSKFGVPEPKQDKSTVFSAENITNNNKESVIMNLMLLPGLAFDYKGNRIGYGAGYYDKYLQSHKPTGFYKAALAYDFQVIDKIDAEEHDIRVDMIITPTRIIVPQSGNMEGLI
jgi:5-formyltetrahydrofolate cyclo-ligase